MGILYCLLFLFPPTYANLGKALGKDDKDLMAILIPNFKSENSNYRMRGVF